MLGSLGMMFWLAMTPHNPETEKKRLAILAGFAFLTGKLKQLRADETVIIIRASGADIGHSRSR